MGAETLIPAAVSVGSTLINKKGAKQEANAVQDANAATLAAAQANLDYQVDRDTQNDASIREYNRQAQKNRDELLRMTQEGYTDPVTGVATKYIPGKGFVTEYSPEASQRINAENRENTKALLVDAPMAREGRIANASRRRSEGDAAQSQLAQLKSADPYDTKRIIADVIAKRRVGVNEGFDKTLKGALTSNMRTGASSDNLVAQLAAERSRSLSDANAGGYTEGAQAAEGLRDARISRLGNTYNMLAGRASNVDNASYAPQTLSTNAANKANTSPTAYAQTIAPTLGAAPQLNLNAIKPNVQQATGTYSNAATLDNFGSLYDILTNSKKKNAGAF